MTLKIENVSVKYSQRVVLHGISHTFDSGWTHILGSNGAGKSTLLKVLASLLHPDEGCVTWKGQDIRGLTALQRAKLVGYVPQRLESIPALTVGEFVAQGCYAWQKMGDHPHDAAYARALKALERLGIRSFASRRMDQLSGGEVQLCVLASAVAQDTQIILLDEPTTGLDICHISQICKALEQLKSEGVTIISTMHDLSLAARYADAFFLLKEGRCAYAGNLKPSASIWADVFNISPDADEIAHLMAVKRLSSLEVHPPVIGVASQRSVSVHTKHWKSYVVWGGICIGLCVVGPFLGATMLLPWDGGPGWEIFWSLRVPRVVWGGICGVVLATCGAVMQALFQNPLATPYTLGVASGASLGAMVAIQVGINGILGVPLSACLGGLLAMGAVLGIASRYGMRQPIYCLMAGVAASMFCSALGMMIQAFATPLTAQQMMRWQLGGLEVVGYSGFLTLPVVILALIYLFFKAQSLNLIGVDSALAATRGIAVERTRVIALLSAGIATSIIVSVCGPIAFVGLIIPNALRRILGADLRHILPLSAFMGASFVMLADMVSRLLERVAWLPVGVISAMIGAPLFIMAIFKKS